MLFGRLRMSGKGDARAITESMLYRPGEQAQQQ